MQRNRHSRYPPHLPPPPSGEMVELTERAAHGDVNAQGRVIDICNQFPSEYTKGGSYSDYREAIKSCQAMAELGKVSAQSALGHYYEITPNHWVEEERWYRKAADQGDARAQFKVGWIYFINQVDKDCPTAVEWFRKAAEQGYAEAQYWLGNLYSNKELCRQHPIKQDLVAASKWYRKAAEQSAGIEELGPGYQNFRYVLGKLLQTGGPGLPPDPAEAAQWFQKAAEAGDTPSQKALGLIYRDASPPTQNYSEAEKWLRRAHAQEELAFIYLNDKDAAKNYAKERAEHLDLEQLAKDAVIPNNHSPEKLIEYLQKKYLGVAEKTLEEDTSSAHFRPWKNFERDSPPCGKEAHSFYYYQSFFQERLNGTREILITECTDATAMISWISARIWLDGDLFE